MASERPEKKRKLTNEELPEEKYAAGLQAASQGFFSSGKLKSADIRKAVIQYFRHGQYEQLQRELYERGFSEKK